MPDMEVDAEDGEVRDSPARTDDRRQRPSDADDRAHKKHRSERDRSRSRERGRADRDRDRKISYDNINYSALDVDRGDPYDRYRSDDRSRDRDRDRDRDRERDRDRDRDRNRDRDRDRDRDRSDRDRDRRDKRDGDRDRDRDRRDDRGRDRTKSDRDRDRDRDRHHRDDDRDRRGGDDKKAPLPPPKEDPMPDDDEEPMIVEEEDAEEILRKKREAILAKFKKPGGVSPAMSSPALPSTSPVQTQPPAETKAASPPKPDPPPVEQKAADVAKEDGDQMSAEETPNSAAVPSEAQDNPAEQSEGGRPHDDDEDDMFSDSPLKQPAPAGEEVPLSEQLDAEDRAGYEKAPKGSGIDRSAGVTNSDNWDDAEGYFRTRPGELIINRYRVNRDIGNGVYSTVISAEDVKESREVAIKVVRSNETMYNAGRKEIEVLKRLGQEDPEGRKHICKLLSHFEYKNHLCMVFVPHEMNLRKLLKTYGREVGITLQAIKAYARQMLVGLLHMIKCQVVHGDIKLDNILISKDLKSVAICDFGTADWITECTITPYMVSRYYRPPEICVGLKYGYAMDLWSVGVCLYELYTGKFMFTGRSNNDMLKQFLDFKGMPSKKMLRKAQFFDQHFEEEKGNVLFKYLTKDVVTKQEVIHKMRCDKPVVSIYEKLMKAKASSDDGKKIKEFADLLDHIFIMDPAKRISVSDALRHPFIQNP